MRPSLHFIVVGAGVLVALGNVALASAETVPAQSQKSAEANQAKIASTPKRWLQAVQEKVSSSTKGDSEVGFPTQSAQAKPSSKKLASSLADSPKRNVSKALLETLQRNRSLHENLQEKKSPQTSVSLVAKEPNVKQPSTVRAFLRSSKGGTTAQNNVRSNSSAPAVLPGQAPNAPSNGSANPIVPGTESDIEPLGKPIGPAKPGAAPEYLYPDPNPLSFPTKPDEVRLRGIQPITLQQALELAERNNRDLQVAGLTVRRSREALNQAEAELYPTIALDATVARSQSASSSSLNGQNSTLNALNQLLGLPANNLTGGNNNSVSRTFNGTATLSYNIFTSGGRPARIRAAGQQLRSDQLQYEVTLEALRLTITSAYYDVQQADAQVRIGQASVRNSQISLRDAQAREQAGLGTRFDTLQAQVTLANSQQTLSNAVAQQQIARRQLAQLLSLSPSADLAAADPVAVAGAWNLSLEESIVLAFKNRAELEQQLAQRELAHQNKLAALSALGPTLSVSAQYQLLNSFGSNGSGWNDGYSVQAGLSWRLFDGGAARASANQQEINVAIAEQNFANNRDQIRFAVEQAYANLLSNRVNITTAQTGLAQAVEALRLARLRFQAGVGTQTDVINQETALTQAQGNLVSAILGYNRALASLRRAVTNLPIATGATESYIPAPAPPPNTNAVPGSTGISPTPNPVTPPSGATTP